MSTQRSASWMTHLGRYTIASADMYYTEWGERDVFLRMDDQGDFHILGKTVGEDTSTEIELCQVFLEYAMSCCACHNLDQALCYMQSFARHIGHSIGEFLKENAPLIEWDNPADRALEYLLHTMNANISTWYCEETEYFVVEGFPLENAAEHSGLCNVELAHHGINVMCLSMMEAINQEVTIMASPIADAEFAFTILKPAFA